MPESQALHAADARSAGDDDGEQDGGDTFRERFGEAIPSWLLDRLEASGFVVPTPVQAEAISAIVLDERDALVQAYTGSGKTLSFLIPLFTVLEQSMRGMDKKKRRLAGVQAVVGGADARAGHAARQGRTEAGGGVPGRDARRDGDLVRRAQQAAAHLAQG